MSPPAFTTAPLSAVLDSLTARLGGSRPGDRIALRVLDPDRGRGSWAGTEVEISGQRYIHRPWRVWCDVAERLRLRLMTPRPADSPLVELVFEVLDPTASWHEDPVSDPEEKYGVTSGFANIAKLEDPGFVLDLAEALRRADLRPGARVLDLGVNTGDELRVLEHVYGAAIDTFEVVGVDHCASALSVAQVRYPRYRFITCDIQGLPSVALEPFDLVLSVGTLQSPGIDDRAVLRHLFAHRLKPQGAVIFGFPNCRYVDGEVLYGAKSKNYDTPEASLWIKDVAFYRKYLQQHRRRVFVTGKHYVWVTGVATGSRSDRACGGPQLPGS